MYDDETDVLYAGTSSGLYAYKQNVFTKLKEPQTKRGNSIFQLQQDGLGNIYCCNLTGQIFKVKGNHLELFYEVSKKNRSNSFRYYLSSKNELFIGAKTVFKINLKTKKETPLFIPEKKEKNTAISNVFSCFSKVNNNSICFTMC